MQTLRRFVIWRSFDHLAQLCSSSTAGTHAQFLPHPFLLIYPIFGPISGLGPISLRRAGGARFLTAQKWTWPRGDPQFCMAEHEEAAAGVLLGMNEGGDPLCTPGNNFEHDISPGPSPALSGGQEAPQRSTDRADREGYISSCHPARM